MRRDDDNTEEMIARDWPPLGKITDRHGITFYIGNAGDYWHAPFPLGRDMDYRTHAKQIVNLKIRDDDILICAYPKTGLNWHSEIVSMLTRKVAKPEKHGYFDGFLDATLMSDIEALPSPRVLLTHVPFRRIPRQALEKKIPIIQLDRNPKDTIVSYYHFMVGHKTPCAYPGTFSQFFDLYLEVGFPYGNIMDYLMDWQNAKEDNPDMNVCVSVFEDMKKDPVKRVKILNDFLGTGCSEELCEQIVEACSFKKLKAFRDANMPEVSKVLFKSKDFEGIYRKGVIGDWKETFTDEMNERFDKEWATIMADYKTKYTYV